MSNDNFKLKLFQTKEDLDGEKKSKHTATMKFCDNKSLPDLKVQLPLNYDGPTNGNNLEKFYTPEHFYLAAIAGCFMTTFLVISKNSQLDYVNISIEADKMIETINERKILTVINQNITLTIPKGISEKKALNVLEVTETYCILGNSVKTKINNNYNIVVEKI